jgi:hypothetical protein
VYAGRQCAVQRRNGEPALSAPVFSALVLRPPPRKYQLFAQPNALRMISVSLSPLVLSALHIYLRALCSYRAQVKLPGENDGREAESNPEDSPSVRSLIAPNIPFCASVMPCNVKKQRSVIISHHFFVYAREHSTALSRAPWSSPQSLIMEHLIVPSIECKMNQNGSGARPRPTFRLLNVELGHVQSTTVAPDFAEPKRPAHRS